MLYTLYYQRISGDTVVIARSNSLLRLLKIKAETFDSDSKAFVAVGHNQFNKFDLIGAEWSSFNDFEKKVDSGCRFATYDYSQRVRELLLNRRSK